MIPPSGYEEKFINDPGTHAGKYEWLQKPKLYELPDMPDELFDFLKNGAGPSSERSEQQSEWSSSYIYKKINSSTRVREAKDKNYIGKSQKITKSHKKSQNQVMKISEGNRDDTLFHLSCLKIV